MAKMTQEELNAAIARHAEWHATRSVTRDETEPQPLKLRRDDFSLLDFSNADLREANFYECDLRGAKFDGARLDDACFQHCNLDEASFRSASLVETRFEAIWNMRGADFRGADLRETDFDVVDSVRTARFSLDYVPLVPKLDRQILELVRADPSRLRMDDWHTGADGESYSTSQFETGCGTAHCRAGWAVHLAGKAGYELERQVGPAVAGMLIYLKSEDYCPLFYVDDQTAIEDLEKRAAGVAL